MSAGELSGEGSTLAFEPPWYYAIEEKNLKEGRLFRVQAAGKDLLVIKNEGQIYILSNICPHARCPLHTGNIEDDYILKCICHGRKFDIRTGECLNDSLKVKRYESKIDNGNIGVKIEENL
ncbi:MAG: Rieske (2Fe-2S) protein [Methanosarcina sp.]